MSRRDTIIIAVLINAGLLVLLFASALKSNNAELDVASATPPSQARVAELGLKNQPAGQSAAGADEVDQVLNQLAASSSNPQTKQPALAAPSQAQGQAMNQQQGQMAGLAASDPNAVPSFADDLKAITMPDGQAPLAAAPTPAPAAMPSFAEEQPQQNEMRQVKVKKGDVLAKIARSNHTTVEEIMRANQLTTTRLKIGQVLKIPSAGSKQVARSAPGVGQAVAAAEGAPKYYTVKNGDNPWTIAVKNQIKVEELLKLNNLNEEKARRLKPGDQIRIR